jgi:phage-related minor tail protein
MEDAVARIRSETGASQDEAEQIAKSANRIAGDQQQSLGAVTDVAIAVHKDMGLVGDQLDKVTEQTVKYARVTKQDGVGAVKALDDIGDAWNLTADQMLAVQGKLLVSNQKWGGSITDNQAALATMAPQLKALGASLDDGISLLNLFAASGLDSSKALGAMNFAVKALKPGQSLNDLIKQVSSIEDPTLRAKKAIELFGAKGGVALANVLKPGVTSLDQFGVSADDAATAVDASWTRSTRPSAAGSRRSSARRRPRSAGSAPTSAPPSRASRRWHRSRRRSG